MASYTRKMFTWLITLFILFVLNMPERVFDKNTLLEILGLNSNSYHDLVVAAHWTVLRCISYNLDVINDKNKPNSLEIVSYCLYLPLFFFGPFIQFENIKQSYQQNASTRKKLKPLLLQLFRFSFWLLFAEISLHFIYVNATTYHPHFVMSLDPWSLYGYGYTMGQFFHIKYVVMYGIATALAKFENVQVPNTPRCIGRVHLYSDMWRHFDPGLHTFLTKYLIS